MTKHPEIKAKLLNEILTPVEKVKDNILEGLTYDTVMEFNYLYQCYSESLRIEPPIPLSTFQSFMEDCQLTVG